MLKRMETIEKNVPLSQSKLWHMQMEYYHEAGPQAWDKSVPYFVTSNAFVGHKYALTYLSFAKDR